MKDKLWRIEGWKRIEGCIKYTGWINEEGLKNVKTKRKERILAVLVKDIVAFNKH